MLPVLALGLVVGLLMASRGIGGGEGSSIEVRILSTIGAPGSGRGQLMDPRGLIVSSSRVLVSDIGRDRVLIFALDGSFIREIEGVEAVGSLGERSEPQAMKALGPLKDPYGLAWGQGEQTFWVGDAWNGAVREFGLDGKERRVFKGRKYGFYGPRGLGRENDFLLVADTGRHQIAVLDMRGRVMRRVGDQNGGTSFFLDPTDVVGLGGGRFAAVDRGHRLSFWNINGDFISSVKIVRSRDAGESPEHGIAVSPEGLVAVTDPQARKVRIYGPKGKTRGWIWKLDQEGKTSLEYPTGLAFINARTLAVADGFHDKVFILELSGL